MNELQISVIDQIVQEVIDDNIESINESLLAGSKRDMSFDQLYVLMTKNAIRTSVSLSVQVVCELLDESGAIHFESDERALRKNLTKILTQRAVHSTDQ